MAVIRSSWSRTARRDPTARHQQGDKNRLIFELLVNKSPQRRIVEVTGITAPILYDRINFFYEQARAFLAHYESKLPEMKIKRLYVGVNRQEYAINWSRREDKKNVILSAVAAADNLSGYVFGMDINFDSHVNAVEVEKFNFVTNDDQRLAPHRSFARLWLQTDYDAALRQSNKKMPAGSINSAIENEYAHAARRSDVESPEIMDRKKALPDCGMLVHAKYSLYGSYMRMARLLKGVEKVRFFLDQDSGSRAGCFGAFANRIKARTADAFYVRITKDQTVDEKRKLVAASKKTFNAMKSANAGLSDDEVRLLMLKNGINAAQAIGQWKDRWVMYPLPTISEAEKASCFLTDMGDYDLDHQAWLHNKASLHAVDSWFNRVRRRCSMLERPIKSASNLGRTYFAYSAYRPEQIEKLLTMLRVCHNFIWTIGEPKKGKTKMTPAMKLGLADAPMTYEDVINFRAPT